jgi:hypothetical protein
VLIVFVVVNAERPPARQHYKNIKVYYQHIVSISRNALLATIMYKTPQLNIECGGALSGGLAAIGGHP